MHNNQKSEVWRTLFYAFASASVVLLLGLAYLLAV